ncbi:MAG: formate dehydrogenase accessory sulfurtransferase FdhD [Acidimicrobiales bacterium]
MSRSRSEKAVSRRVHESGVTRRPHVLLVEEPLSIRIGDTLVSTTMRTPGHDFELAAGFALAEGYVSPDGVAGIRYCGAGTAFESEFNVVSIATHQPVEVAPRLGSISSSCGICGTEAIDQLASRITPLRDYEPWDVATMLDAAQSVRPLQALFDATGSSHAAAAFTRSGELLAVREDIGRHNAVDKIVGHLLLDGQLPATDLGLFVSGRASFEMVQKAWSAGFTALVAVSGPSTLAVAAARRAQLTLLGFARNTTATIYYPE